MKKALYFAVAAVLAISMLAMTACSGGSLSADAQDEKNIIITADKADEDHEITIGTLEVGEGEQVVLSADLEEGALKIELFAEPEDQSIDELPEIDGEPVFWAELANKDNASGTLEAGSYMIKITPTEKATGTATIAAGPAK